MQLESQKEVDRKNNYHQSKLKEKIKQNDQPKEQLESNKDNSSELMKQIQDKEKINTQQQQDMKDMRDEITSANDLLKQLKKILLNNQKICQK